MSQAEGSRPARCVQVYIMGNLHQSGAELACMVDTGANTPCVIEKRVYEMMRASFPADFDEPEKLKEAVTARTAGKGNTVRIRETGRFRLVLRGP